MLAGAATGLRSPAAVAALITVRAPGLPDPLTGRPTRTAALLAVAGELAADKLPSAPSGLGRAGLSGRLVCGSAAHAEASARETRRLTGAPMSAASLSPAVTQLAAADAGGRGRR